MVFGVFLIAALLLLGGLAGLYSALNLIPTDLGLAHFQAGTMAFVAGLMVLAFGFGTRAVLAALRRIAMPRALAAPMPVATDYAQPPGHEPLPRRDLPADPAFEAISAPRAAMAAVTTGAADLAGAAALAAPDLPVAPEPASANGSEIQPAGMAAPVEPTPEPPQPEPPPLAAPEAPLRAAPRPSVVPPSVPPPRLRRTLADIVPEPSPAEAQFDPYLQYERYARMERKAKAEAAAAAAAGETARPPAGEVEPVMAEPVMAEPVAAEPLAVEPAPAEPVNAEPATPVEAEATLPETPPAMPRVRPLVLSPIPAAPMLRLEPIPEPPQLTIEQEIRLGLGRKPAFTPEPAAPAEPEPQPLAEPAAPVDAPAVAAVMPEPAPASPGLIADADLAALQDTTPRLPSLDQLEVVGSYDSAGTRYTMYSDGSVVASGPAGEVRYPTLQDLRRHLDSIGG